MVRNSIFFRTFGRFWRFYTRMCAGLCRTYWTTFGIAEKNINGSCPMHEWDHPQFFEFLTPPPHPRGRWAPQGRGHVGRHCPYTNTIWCGSVQALLRYRSKTAKKAKNSPLTPIVTKISFPRFSARRGSPIHKRGEDTLGTRVRPHAKFCVNWPAGCREIVDKKRTKQQK